jgi:L-serine dehydratase
VTVPIARHVLTVVGSSAARLDRHNANQGVYVSALELFSVGIGPSSSHTVGPMRAAAMFRDDLASNASPATRFEVVLMGSLAATGIGHGTPDAIVAGLRGFRPETVDPAQVHGEWDRAASGATIWIDNVRFTSADLTFEPRWRSLEHPNTLMIRAYAGDDLLLAETYLSVGGGFVTRPGKPPDELKATRLASKYRTASELLREARDSSIAEVAWADEVAQHGEEIAAEGIDRIWRAMNDSIENGLVAEGRLPGSLRVPRRASSAWRNLRVRDLDQDAAEALSIYAMAVNEENAAGGRVVTAPTNGAAGVIPATLRHVLAGRDDPLFVRKFLLTAAAIGSLIKANASISGAVGGCQAEVGSACAMAAAGITAIRGGSPEQVENAAEIALEHHFGLTCDPVGGLVQIPCIERNAIAAATALTASRLAMLGDGTHIVPLDTAIEVMRQTGADMSDRYKETSAAGLAVNVVEC